MKIDLNMMETYLRGVKLKDWCPDPTLGLQWMMVKRK